MALFCPGCGVVVKHRTSSFKVIHNDTNPNRKGVTTVIQEILHVSSRCGGGKSTNTLKELHQYLVGKLPAQETVIFASPTNKLSNQNHFEFSSLSKASSVSIAAVKVDSDERKGQVVKEVSDLLKSSFEGVIFTSHMAVSLVDPVLLKGVRLFFDEIPKDIVKTLTVRHEAKDYGDAWQSYITDAPSPYKGYQKAVLIPGVRDEVERYIKNIRTEKDNTKTVKVAELLEFLLADYEVMYTTTVTKKRSFTYYQAMEWQKLERISQNVGSMAILSAQLKDSLFGFVAQKRLGLRVVEADITSKLRLEGKHRNKVRIIPFLATDRWSSSLKGKPANEVLLKDDQEVSSTETVTIFAQKFAESLMGDRGFTITLNRKDTLIGSLKRDGVVEMPTSVHGMNQFRKIDHAVYLASNRPTSFEVRHLQMFASDHGLSREDIVSAVVTERCHETAYQCVARTSIRNPKPDHDKEHLIVVPDMEYANYIASWFEEGFAIIDTQHSFTTLRIGDQQKAADLRKQVVINILLAKQRSQGKLMNLIKQAGISDSTYKRYKKEFHDELVQLGYLKAKVVP